MKNIMKYTAVYWILILAPLIYLAIILIQNKKSHSIICLLFYFLIYRPFIDFYRLKAKNKINLREFWKMYIPIYRLKHFISLYWR